MIELQQLRELVAFWEAGSLSAAAEELDLSQPSLSRSMQRLEAELGLQLFDRRKNRLVFRELGLRAVEGAKRILLEAESFEADLRDYAERLSIVRIGASSPAPLWRLSTMIHEHFPNVVIAEEQRTADELAAGMREGRFRLVLTHVPIREEGILCRKYLEERLILELPPEHPLCALRGLEEADLTGLTVLSYRNIGIWRDRLDQLEGMHRIEQTDVAVLEDLVRSSRLPILTSSLRPAPTASFGGRVSLPILSEKALLPFYLCGHKRDQALFEKL